MPDNLIREDLATLYRIVYELGLDDHTYTHMSSRSQSLNSYYILPFGLRFEEVTKNNLMHISLSGNIIQGQEKQYNKTGYILHGEIYKQRSDIKTILHVHTPEIVAISCIKDGLMPLSQWSYHFYNKIAYHEYNSLLLDATKQGIKLVSDLGDKNVMIMRNHGALTCGRTIHEALFYLYHLQMAAKTQIYTLSQNKDLLVPSKEILESSVHDLLNFEEDLGRRDWAAWVRKIQHSSE